MDVEETNSGEAISPDTESGAIPAPEPTDSGHLGDPGLKALSTEREARRKAEKELTEYKRRLEEANSSGKTLETRVAELESSQRAAERRAMVLQVVTETGLPASMADRLQGDDLESIKADAEELKKMIPSPAPTPVSVGGPQGPPSATKTPEDWRQILRSRR